MKLTIGFAIVLIIAIIAGVIGIIGMRTLQRSEIQMYENRVRGIEYVNEAESYFSHMRLESRNIMMSSLYDDKKGAADSYTNFELNAENFISCMEKIREIADDEETLEFHDRILELFENGYLPKAREINERNMNEIPDHNNKLYINVLIASRAETSARIRNLLSGLIDLNSGLARQASINNNRLTQLYIILLIFFLILAVLGGGAVAFLITKSISAPINESVNVLREIARGNFKARVTGNYKDDFKIVKDSLNYTAEQLSVYLDKKICAERSLHEADLAKARIEAASEALMSSIAYASKIQRNLLPPDEAMTGVFIDWSVIWEPRDIVGGDIYWLKRFHEGTVLCIADCTGHGTPGALLTMLVTSALEAIVWPSNCHDTAEIINKLDHRLSAVLHVESGDGARHGITDIDDGCDLAVLFIAKDGSVRFSSGKIPIFVCDGSEVIRYKGQKIFIGEGKLKNKDEVDVIDIPANPGCKFYVASDGLFDQIGGDEGRQFGYEAFKQIILENHNEKLADITARIWDAFEEYRGEETRRDDFELIAFEP